MAAAPVSMSGCMGGGGVTVEVAPLLWPWGHSLRSTSALLSS